MNGILVFALLAVSMVSAFPLAGEAFAQTTTERADWSVDTVLHSAVTLIPSDRPDNLKVDKATSVVLTFQPRIGFVSGTVDATDFTIDGKQTISVTPGASGSPTQATLTLTVAPNHGFAVDDTPTVRLSPGESFSTARTVNNETHTVNYTKGSVKADDKILPFIVSAQLTKPNEITVKYSEPVTSTVDSYRDLKIIDADRDPSSTPVPHTTFPSNNSSPATTHTIQFSPPTTTGATGTISVYGDIKDSAGNALSSTHTAGTLTGTQAAEFGSAGVTVSSKSVVIADGQIPRFISAEVTEADKITVTFSEILDSTASTTSTSYYDIIIDNSPYTAGTPTPPASTPLCTVDDDCRYTIPLVSADDETAALKSDASGIMSIRTMNDDAPAPANTMKAQHNVLVSDGQSPSIMSTTIGGNTLPDFKITAPDKITLKFDESVIIVGDPFDNLVISPTGEDIAVAANQKEAEITNSSASLDTITLTFELDDELQTDAIGRIDIKSDKANKLTDQADNDLISLTTNNIGNENSNDDDITISDGQSPTLVKASVTSSTNIKIEFSENVVLGDTTTDHFGNIAISGAPNVTVSEAALDSVDNSIVNVTFEPATTLANANGSITILGGDNSINDASGNAVQPKPYPVNPGQIPTVESAQFTDSNEVTIKFSEPVERSDSDASWSTIFPAIQVNGESGVRSVNSTDTTYITSDGEDANAATDRLKLAVSGDKGIPTGAIGHMRINAGLVDNPGEDEQIELAPVARQAITDGQPPELALYEDTTNVPFMSVTGPNTIQINFTEDVRADKDDFDELFLGDDAEKREITNVRPTGFADALVLTFGGDEVDSDAKGRITIADGVMDTDGNKFIMPNYYDNDELSALPDEPAVADGEPDTWAFIRDGQKPTLETIKITDRNEITATFSEAVEPREANKSHFPAFRNFTVDGVERTITLPGGGLAAFQLGDTMVFAVSGAPIDVDASGTINIDSNIVDAAGNQIDPETAREVMAGQRPIVEKAEVVSDNEIVITFDELVTVDRSNFSNLTVNDRTATIQTVTPRGEMVSIGFDFDTPYTIPTDATASVTANGVMDRASQPNSIAENTRIDVKDGQPPKLDSAAITGKQQVTLKFSEVVTLMQDVEDPIDAQIDITSLSIGATGEHSVRNVTDVSPAMGEMDNSKIAKGNTIIVEFDEDPAMPNHTGTISISPIEDEAGNKLAQLTDQTVKDGQVPELLRAEHSERGNLIVVKYSEDVSAIPRSSYTNLLPSGSNTSIDLKYGVAPANTHHLSYTGDRFTTSATMSVSGIKDVPGGNDMPPLPQAPVHRHDKPTINTSIFSSGTGTSINMVSVTFSEPVMAESDHFTVTIPGQDRTTIEDIAGSGTTTIILTLEDPVSDTTTGTLSASSDIEDLFGKALEPVTAMQINPAQSADRIPPTLSTVSIVSNNQEPGFAEEGDQITLTFMASESIQQPTVTILGKAVSATSPDDDGVNWSAMVSLVAADIQTAAESVTFTIDYTDLAGNNGQQVTTTTDGTSVMIAMCPTGQHIHPHTQECATLLDGTVTIGVLNTTSWNLVGFDQAVNKAVNDFNEYLGENNREWTLAVEPMTTSVDGGEIDGEVIERIVDVVTDLRGEGIEVITGVPTSEEVTQIQNYINDNDMVLISCCSTAPQLGDGEDDVDNVFRMISNDSGEAPKLAPVIMGDGNDSIVIIYRNDAWGIGLVDVLENNYPGEVLGKVSYDEAEKFTPEHFTRIVTQAASLVENRDTTGIVFLGWDEIKYMMHAANDTALDGLDWYGSGANANTTFIDDDDYMAGPFAERNNFTLFAFEEDHNELSEELDNYLRDDEVLAADVEPTAYVYSTYDAVYLAGLAIDRAQSNDGEQVVKYVRSEAADRTGAVGSNELTEQGDLALDSYVQWHVASGQWVRNTDLATISGMVTGPNDQGISGASITIGDLSVMTDSDGEYYANVAAGTHTVTLTVPPGYELAQGQSNTRTVMVEAGGNEMVDFVLALSAAEGVTLDISAFTDANGNGVRDAGEAPFAGLLVLTYMVDTEAVGILTTGTDGTASTTLTPNNFYAIALPDDGDRVTTNMYEAGATTYYGVLHEASPGAGSTITMEIGVLPGS